MFKRDIYRDIGMGTWQPEQIVAVILSIISVIAAILILANFDTVTAKIAIGVVNILTSWVPKLVLVLLVIIGIVYLKWKVRRRYWLW